MAYKDDLMKVASLDLPWEKLEGCNILVTGATGLIGSCLVEALLSRKGGHYQVYASGRNEERAKRRFSDFKNCSNFHFFRYDVTDPLQSDIEFHYIIDAASNASPNFFATKPVEVIKSNIEGVCHLLDEVVDPLGVEGLSYFPIVVGCNALIEGGESVSLAVEFEDDVFLVSSIDRFGSQFECVAFCGVGFPVEHVGERAVHDSLFDAVDGVSADFPLPCMDVADCVASDGFDSMWICIISESCETQIFYDSIKQVETFLII